MADLLLVVRLAGRRIAFPAVDVEGVVELEELIPAPGTAPHVAGLSALRSRVLTVIDGLAALGADTARGAAIASAVIVPSGGYPYALLVDEVEDVIEAASAVAHLAAPAGAGWDRVAIGMVEAGGVPLLLVDPHALIAGPAIQAA